MFAHYIFVYALVYTDFPVYTQAPYAWAEVGVFCTTCERKQISQYSADATDWTIRSSNPGIEKCFSILLHVKTGPGPHPASYSVGTGFLSWR